jgi:hypothetical protein
MSWYIFPLRLAGHMLFTSVIALWYSLGSFARMRWIDNGAKRGLLPFLLSNWPGLIMTVWIIIGIFLAALFHSCVNLFASAGHYMAVVIEAIGWTGVLFFLFNKKSERPYGRILQEIKLMQQLHNTQVSLDLLQHPVIRTVHAEKEYEPHFHVQKMRFSRKQVAKK